MIKSVFEAYPSFLRVNIFLILAGNYIKKQPPGMIPDGCDLSFDF